MNEKEILRKLDEYEIIYRFFKNPFSEYNESRVIKTKNIFVEPDDLEKEFAFLKNLNDKEKEIVKENIIKIYGEYIPHPKGLHSPQIFGTVKKKCMCGKTSILYKKCPICNVSVLLHQDAYLRKGYIRLNYPIPNPLFENYYYKILGGGKSMFNMIIENPYLDYKFLLYDKKRRRFVIPQEFKFSKILSSNDIRYEFDELKLTTRYHEFVEKFFKFAQDSNLLSDDNITIDSLKNKYKVEFPIFGLYSLQLAILADDDIFERFYELFEHEHMFLLSMLLIVPVVSSHIRKYTIHEGQVFKHPVDNYLIQIVSVYETIENSRKESLNLDEIYTKSIVKPFITDEYLEVYDDYKHRGIMAIKSYLQNVIDEIRNMKIVDLIQQEKIVTRDLYRFTRDYYEYYVSKIKGKEGEIRKNIVGKTIDFSSRNVITPTLKIKPYEVLISYHSGRELFKMEFIIFLKKLYKALYYNTFEVDGELFVDRIKVPKYMVDRLNRIKIKNSGRWFKKLLVTVVEELETGAASPKEVTDNDEIINDLEFLYDLFVYNVNKGIIKLYTFINRQPTLWHLSIMAYDAKINTDKNDYTLKIHPLIVEAYNADFDGDSFAEAIVAVELDNTTKIDIYHNQH